MSFDIVISVLASTAVSGVTQQLWEVMRGRLEERGFQEIPKDVTTDENREQAEAALESQGASFSPDESHKLTIEALLGAHGAANAIRAERMRQAKWTFNSALTLAIVGVLIIFAGVVLILFKEAPAAGAITACVGAVSEVLSAVLFKLNNQTNNRLDEVGRDLSAIEAARIAMTLIEKIEDPQKRDDAIKEAAKDLRIRSSK